MIRQILRRLAGPPAPADAGRALAARALAIKAAHRRQEVINHLTKFGPAGERGLRILNGETHDA